MRTQSGYSFPSDSKRISVQGGWQSHKGNNDGRDSCQTELVFQCNSCLNLSVRSSDCQSSFPLVFW